MLLLTQNLMANMPPPRYYTSTHYHFTNVSTFPSYTFYIKNLQTKKVKKLNQDDVVVITKNSLQKCVEIWCVNKKDKVYSDTISLCIKSNYHHADQEEYHSKIDFVLENNKLSYNQEAYNEKKENNAPLFYITNDNSSDNIEVLCSFIALLVFTMLYFFKTGKLKLHV